jgi:N-glycosylase/DNA lyase
MRNNRVKEVVEEVRKLASDPAVRKVVKQRIKEFQATRSEDSYRWFEELVFCILTANSSAETGLRCVNALKEKNHIFHGSKGRVRKTLEGAGHRFAARRAEYIVLARKGSKELKENVLRMGNTVAAREWLVKNFKGIGWKEGSHFLRNVGFLDVAILDRHVLRIMSEYGLVKEEARSLSKKKYLEHENILRRVSSELGMPLGELDLYLWYIKTGTIKK